MLRKRNYRSWAANAARGSKGEKMVVKDEFGRFYKVENGFLITTLGKKYMAYEEAEKKLNIRKARKSWEEICNDWEPAGKLIRNKKNRNR
jgi:hypothetical protein